MGDPPSTHLTANLRSLRHRERFLSATSPKECLCLIRRAKRQALRDLTRRYQTQRPQAGALHRPEVCRDLSCCRCAHPSGPKSQADAHQRRSKASSPQGLNDSVFNHLGEVFASCVPVSMKSNARLLGQGISRKKSFDIASSEHNCRTRARRLFASCLRFPACSNTVREVIDIQVLPIRGLQRQRILASQIVSNLIRCQREPVPARGRPPQQW